MLECTRFDIRSLTEDMTWESISCDEIQAEFGVCEYKMESQNNTLVSHQAGKIGILCSNWHGLITRKAIFSVWDLV